MLLFAENAREAYPVASAQVKRGPGACSRRGAARVWHALAPGDAMELRGSAFGAWMLCLAGCSGGGVCPEYEAPPASTSTECRSDGDCGGSGSCWAPGDTSAYYTAGFCPMECGGDVVCFEGLVCVPLNGGSCSQCRPSCDTAGCGQWETCGDDGRCRPQRCDEGYVCPAVSSCMVGASGVDAHGCTIVSCDDDGDCGCGSCVLGACALGPGRCEPPRP